MQGRNPIKAPREKARAFPGPTPPPPHPRTSLLPPVLARPLSPPHPTPPRLRSLAAAFCLRDVCVEAAPSAGAEVCEKLHGAVSSPPPLAQALGRDLNALLIRSRPSVAGRISGSGKRWGWVEGGRARKVPEREFQNSSAQM